MTLTKEQFHVILVESGALEEDVFARAAASPKAQTLGIDEILIDEDILEDDQIGQLVALWYGVPFVRLHQQPIEKDLLARIPETFARFHRIIPLRQEKDHVVVAMCVPDNLILRSLLEKHFRCPVVCVYATARDLQESLYLFAEDPKIIFERLLEEKESVQREQEHG